MAKKNTAEVLINGKIYTISGTRVQPIFRKWQFI